LVEVDPEEEELDRLLLELLLSIARPVLAKGPAMASEGAARRAKRERTDVVDCMPISLRHSAELKFRRNSYAHRKIRGAGPRTKG
jgi:hypothetical protein